MAPAVVPARGHASGGLVDIRDGHVADEFRANVPGRARSVHVFGASGSGASTR